MPVGARDFSLLKKSPALPASYSMATGILCRDKEARA